MCQLSRHAIERQKTLQLHKNLTLITYRVQTALHGVQSDFQAFHAEIKQVDKPHVRTAHKTYTH